MVYHKVIPGSLLLALYWTLQYLTTLSFVVDAPLQVSSKFAEASSKKEDGESTFGEKVDCLEAKLRKAENQTLEAQVKTLK